MALKTLVITLTKLALLLVSIEYGTVLKMKSSYIRTAGIVNVSPPDVITVGGVSRLLSFRMRHLNIQLAFSSTNTTGQRAGLLLLKLLEALLST